MKRDKQQVWGSPSGTGGKEPVCQCQRRKRCGRDPWVQKIPWRKAWRPTLVFLPGESHGQRSLAVYISWGHRESDRTERQHNTPMAFAYCVFMFVSVTSDKT